MASDQHSGGQQQQDNVFVIDESIPQASENEDGKGESCSPRPPSPSRTTSITEEEALG